jgi:hypothetical protein
MELLAANEFLSWAATNGIVTYRPDDTPSGMVFNNRDSEGRFWNLPPGRQLPYFFWHALSGLPAWSKLYLWPRHGRWLGDHADAVWHDRVQAVMLRAAGAPAGGSGALTAAPHEMPQILTAAFTSAVFGCHTADDLYLIPDNARAILWIDHHDVLNVDFRDAADVQPFVEHMATGKYFLPDELPDETFKKPHWMDGGESENQ